MTGSPLVVHDTIVFILEWNVNVRTLLILQGLLSKAFCDMAKKVSVRVKDEGKLITND